MLERSLEIVVRHAFRDIFGADWTHVAQQMGLPSGRIDLLFQDGDKVLHVVELKKGPAVSAAIDQVLGYAGDLRRVFPEKAVVPWVVANAISAVVADRSREHGVRVKGIPEAEVRTLMTRNGIGEADLVGARRGARILHGGGSKRGLRQRIANSEAYGEMPGAVADLLREWEGDRLYEIASGGMQTTIWYRGIKLGGVNRRHRGGVAYLAEGVAISDDYERRIEAAGFRRMEKTHAGSSHVHVWWETPWSNLVGIRDGFAASRNVVDRVFGV